MSFVFSTADCEAELERRGIRTDSRFRVSDDESCYLWSVAEGTWIKLLISEYRSVLATKVLRFYRIRYTKAQRKRPPEVGRTPWSFEFDGGVIESTFEDSLDNVMQCLQDLVPGPK